MARSLAKGVRRALTWCHEHNPREIAEKIPAGLRIEDRTAYEQAVAHSVQALSSDGVMPREAVEAEKRMLSFGIKNTSLAQLDVTRTFTNDYLHEDRQ